MPRNISFMLTKPQVYNKTKTVTRRNGWWFLKPGDILNAVEKSQGLKKGEKIVKICPIRIVRTNPEELRAIDYTDCIREGFPELRPEQFVYMFCKSHKKCTPKTIINRIEFEYI